MIIPPMRGPKAAAVDGGIREEAPSTPGREEASTPGMLFELSTHAHVASLAVYIVVGHGLLLVAIVTGYYTWALLADFQYPLLAVCAHSAGEWALRCFRDQRRAGLNSWAINPATRRPCCARWRCVIRATPYWPSSAPTYAIGLPLCRQRGSR